MEGGDLNEFEFQKSQSEMGEDSQLPFSENTEKPNPTDATKRIAQVTADAHRKVEKRKRRGLVSVGSRKSNASSKRSAKKAVRKSSKKETTWASTKKRASSKRSDQKVARKPAQKGTRVAGPKKRA